MAQIASEALVERLIDWGVDTVFGLPGDGINGIMEGLRRHRDKLEFVLVHHEEAAAFMATAHAKATGRIGVCLATSGPGGIHLLNGLYDAKLDHVPVLAITGMQETSLLGTGYQQEVALDRLFADVAEYDMMISNPVQIPAVTDMAIRTAYARRGVAHITIPNDIQVADAGADPWQHVAPASTPKTAAVYLAAAGLPAAQETAAARRLPQRRREDRHPGGAGALHAREELLAVAEALDAPIVKTLPGKAAVPDDSPVHHRRDRAARHQAVRGPDGRDRHAADGRHQLPVHQAPAAEGRCAARRSRPTRPGPAPASPPRCRSSATRSRRCAPCCRCSSSGRSTTSSRSTTQEMNAWRRKMAALEDAGARPDRPAVPDGRDQRAGRRRRHPDLRQRHDRHLGGAALDDPRRAAVLPVGQPGHDGARACRTRSASSTPSPAGR